jgi:myosin protein heavy chain
MSAVQHVRKTSRVESSLSVASNTFSPSFIQSSSTRASADTVDGIEGENDFSGKRYVWVKDPKVAFVKGWIVEELGEGNILVQCDDGSVRLKDPRPVPQRLRFGRN